MWDGIERRTKTSMAQDDHDLLVKIHTNLDNFISKFEDHEISDEKKFDKHDSRLTLVERGLWIGIGSIAVIQIILKFIG